MGTQIRLSQITGSFGNSYLAGEINDGGDKFDIENKGVLSAIKNQDLSGSLSYLATAIRRIHGGGAFSNQAVGTFSTAIVPDSTGGRNVGTVDAEWGDFYAGASKKMYFGADQEGIVGDTGSGALMIGTATSDAIIIGNDSHTGAIQIGAVAAAKTITVGSSTSAEVEVNAVRVDVNAGSNGFQIDGAGNSNLSTSGTGTITIDSAGALTMDTDGTDAINLGIEAAAKTITVGNAASTEVEVNAILVDINAAGGGFAIDGGAASNLATSAGALTITAAATSTWSTAAGADLVIDAGGTLTLDTDGTDAINIGTEAAAKTITVGNDSSTKVDVNAALIELDAASKVMVAAASTAADAISVVSDGGMDLVAAAGALDISTSGGNNAINVLPHNTGTLTLGVDANTKVDVNALTVELDAGTKVVVDSAGTGTDAVKVTSAGGIDIGAAAGFDATFVNGGLKATGLLVVSGATGAKFGDDTGRLEFNGAGNAGTNGVVELTMTGTGVSMFGDDTATLEFNGSGAVTTNGVTTLDLNASSHVTIDSSGGEIKIADDNVAQNVKIARQGAREMFVGNTTAGMEFKFGTSKNMVISGSGLAASPAILMMSASQGVGFSADTGHRGGNKYNGGIYVANNDAEFATLRGISGVDASTSIIGAINAVSSLVASTEPTLFTSSSWRTEAAGNVVTVSKVAGDVNNLQNHAPNKVQVFVNGQCLALSGAGGAAVPTGKDYVIQGTGTANQIKFGFALQADDEIVVWDFS